MRDVKDPSYIKEIAHIMDAHGLSKIHVIDSPGENHSGEIILEKAVVQSIPQIATLKPVPKEVQPASSPTIPDSTGKDITSPMVGVFYASPSPESDPFVSIGDTVKKGDTLCIIEAMKLMNEITAEHDGKILDICAKSGDVVEFGQVLFKQEVI